MSALTPDNPNPDGMEPQEEELSFFDKFIAVFTEPKMLFEKLSQSPPKAVDWALPFFIVLIVVALGSFITMQDEVIRSKMIQERIAAVEKNLDEQVQSGEITPSQKEERMLELEDQMRMFSGTFGMVFQTITIIVLGFIFFFIVSGIYYLIARFAFGDHGSYQAMLVANGMAAYITIIQVILAAILSLVSAELISDTSLGQFIDFDTSTLMGYLVGHIDPIAIWSYAVAAIGMSKMFKAESPNKYFAMVFGLWIVWVILSFFTGSDVVV